MVRELLSRNGRKLLLALVVFVMAFTPLMTGCALAEEGSGDPTETAAFVPGEPLDKNEMRITFIHQRAEGLVGTEGGHPEYKMVLHSDQGSVYASKDFNDLLSMYNIVHSMSRAGTPTDNAAMEAINGWIKAELFMDFHVTGDGCVDQEIDDYIVFFNEQRPAYSLNYLTPRQYWERFAPVIGC